MNKIAAIALLLAVSLAAAPGRAAEEPAAAQSKVNATAAKQQTYPKIVLYSVAWCPHCKEAKEYFTKNNIPFINKDVELDDKAMDELTKKYKSQGVPVIVIGDDQKVLKGFYVKNFEKALKEVRGK